MRCRHRQTSRCFEKSSKTGNHTLNCWHHIVKIPENLRHSQSSRDISGHRTRQLPLPIRLQSGLLHEQNGYSSYQRSTLPCEAQEKTRQTTKKTWYEPMAASSQAGTEACIFRTVQSKQCERQDQIYRRIKTNSRKKDGLKVSS